MKKALIFGVTGQDGSYLADILLEKGYAVYGMIRRSATGNTINIEHLLSDERLLNKRFFPVRGDLADPTSLMRLINEIRPDEIYNEADQDHVSWSFDMVGYSADITGAAVGRILEIIRQVDPEIRFFQPCTSNMFGESKSDIQDETTHFNPMSTYAVGKITAYYFAKYYRQAFGMHVSTGILYNHESPRRTTEYVTRKITNSVARIKLGKQDNLRLGDLSARIDWGYAREYMAAAWQMLQQPEPDDYIIATGQAFSVQEFMERAFDRVGLNPADYLEQDQALFRPTKTSALIGDISKAQRVLGFNPKYAMPELVDLMVDADLALEA